MNFDTFKVCSTPAEVHRQVNRMWKTAFFSAQHRGGGFVTDIVERFADMPRFFFEMSDPHNEYAHFSTWWGGIPFRKYDNPYIHDLYLIHEMSHAGEMVYVPHMTFENFLRKMTDNELHASVVSEVQIYFEIPGLRKLTFPHTIYADRFLEDKAFVERYKKDKNRGFEEMKIRRRNTMMDTKPSSTADFWIHRFYNQNAAWGACWAQSYDDVEIAMAKLRDGVHNGDSEAAMTRFLLWLHTKTTNDIPFEVEAKAFAGVYWANRAHYDKNMMAEAEVRPVEIKLPIHIAR